MKKILSIFLVFFALICNAQHDYTGNIIHIKNTVVSSDPRGKLFIVDDNEDSLYLPPPASVSGRVLAVIPNPYTAFVRLNQNVTYRNDNTTGFNTVNFLYKTTQISYLYSNGTAYEYYIGYIPPAVVPLVAAINTTLINAQLPYSAVVGDFGKTLNFLGGSEFLNLPDPTTIATPVKSFKIVNQGKRQLILNYPFKVDGQTRTGISMNEGGNMWELIAEGGIYRAISNH